MSTFKSSCVSLYIYKTVYVKKKKKFLVLLVWVRRLTDSSQGLDLTPWMSLRFMLLLVRGTVMSSCLVQLIAAVSPWVLLRSSSVGGGLCYWQTSLARLSASASLQGQVCTMLTTSQRCLSVLSRLQPWTRSPNSIDVCTSHVVPTAGGFGSLTLWGGVGEISVIIIGQTVWHLQQIGRIIKSHQQFI